MLDGEELVGGWSYRQVSNYLVAGLLFAVAVAIVLKPCANMTGNYYLPLLALAMLGWALLTTGMSARYLIYPLCLLILARPALSGGGFLAGVAMISTTIAITVLGTFAFHISGVPELVPALHADNNAGARLFMFLYSDDRVITLGSFGNMVVLVWLAAAVFRLPLLPWGRGNKEVAADSEE